MLRIGAVALLAISLCGAAAAASAKQAPTRPTGRTDVTDGYRGAIVVDAATGKVLFEDNADFVNPPASMTKLMTFAVLSDRIAAGAFTLESPVRIDASDARMGGTQVYLDARETFPVEELIYAMMIESANDAAHALGRFAGGSVPAFVDLMNAKARALGMTNTTFRTPHGLPASSRRSEDGDLTSPRDFALLSRYLVQNTDVLKYTVHRTRPFANPPKPPRTSPATLTNHNNLLGKVAGVDGLKTGYTSGASFCISATAERNGRRVIVVTMGGASARSRDLKVTELLDRGFALVADTPMPAAPAGKAPAVSTIPLPATPRPAPPAEAEIPRLTVPRR